MSSAETYIDQFRTVVLAYINSDIEDSVWKYFRDLARDGLQEEPVEGSEYWTREELVKEGVTVDGESLESTLAAFKGRMIVEIGTIEERSVRFIVEEGVFLWSPKDNEDDALSLWLTYPSYPPGW
jgi:hypothetical protein